MDSENDNEQLNLSSTSSSNNSSSSNLLVNLPMLPMRNSQQNDDGELEDQMPLHPPSPPLLGSNQQQVASTGHQQPEPIADNSVFISPLLFNNNTTPPPSSSSSSSSSSSHNLHLYHHHQHSEHLHHQHSPPPFSHQQQAPTSPHEHDQDQEEEEQQPQQQPSILNDNITVGSNTGSIDASSSGAVGIDDINLNAEVASTSRHQEQQHQQQQQQQPSQQLQLITVATSEASTSAAGVVREAFALPNTLPLPLQVEPKEPHAYSSHFSRIFTQPLQHNIPGFSSYNNTFGFNVTKRNGATMFNNDNAGAPNLSPGGSSHSHQNPTVDRLKMLYPNVNENETPLPRCWSPHDKCLSIGLTQNNLRVHYKGIGKQHNDAASVRTAYPIPPSCGLYYFEVKIISKGKNGYMGIGLTAQQFRMNRLPGWDKQSYGYHGDDGNSFSSSGNGQSYGPTFTTGDVIGCCVNFVNNTCFYTKNGIDLGIAFRDLPVHKTKLYPTVGLQTPGEEVDANFGQEPFKFDQIEDMMKQMRAEMKAAIYDFPMPVNQGDPTTLLHKMVSSYLVHNGYSQTADAFARTTGQTFREDLSSIRNRQKILKLVMSGKIGQAIEHTLRSYPGLLENNKNLWFMLKCRQFIEMVNGADVEYYPNNKSTNTTNTTHTQTTPLNQTSVIQSTKSYQNGKCTEPTNNAQTSTSTNTAVINDHQRHHLQDKNNLSSSVDNCSTSGDATSNNRNNELYTSNTDYLNDVEMENNGHTTNGNVCKSENSNNLNNSIDLDEEMDIDMPATRKYSHGIERILEFGKELSQMGQQLEKEDQMNDEDRQMLEDAFSLIAYSNPWSSPLGWQLCPSKRETVCTALNSAILESMNYPRRPPLDVCVAHASELLKLMAQASLGACAFVNIEDIFPQN